MAALLITPAATARPWTERLVVMMVLAGIAGGLSGLVGSYISFAAPNMPTGPWIVMCLSFLALFSLFLAPRRGVLARIRQQRQNRRKILSENLLKSFYHLREHNPETLAFSRGEILEKRAFSEVEYKTALRHLRRHFYLIPEGSNWRLSEKGYEEAKRVVRLHRLWEMYLTERMRLKADHIHPNAETMEHIITPEIEEQLLRELGYPETDPHQSPIPYPKH